MKRVWVKGSLSWLKVHPWVFTKHLKRSDPELKKGECCAVHHEKGQFLGSAIFNPSTRVTLRFYSRKEEYLDYPLIKMFIERAWAYRERYFREESAFRIVFGESDSLPGLIVDKYGEGIVFQIHSFGMEKRRDDIIHALSDLFSPSFLVEKSESFARREEGLEPRVELIQGDVSKLIISLRGFKYRVDPMGGQKTGFFLDQTKNRDRVEFHARGKKKGLDLFCHTGGFTLHLLRAGLEKVYAVDRGAEPLQLLHENLRLNEFASDRVLTFEKDAFEFLDEMLLASDKFDVIVIDPPAFSKGRRGLEGAIKGYTLLHDRALRLLEEGGLLATFTCSQAIDDDTLLKTVERAAVRLQRNLFVLETLGQPEDHPILLGFPPSHYLKGFILQAI